MTKAYYSTRAGLNPNVAGFPLIDVIEGFIRVFDRMQEDGYFDQAFGDYRETSSVGELRDIAFEVLKTVRKKNIWPIYEHYKKYKEDDFFDIVEFLFQHVSAVVERPPQRFNWEKAEVRFDKAAGQRQYRRYVNEVLDLYVERFELDPSGRILKKPEVGFEPIFEAVLPTQDSSIKERVTAAVIQFRRHGATVHDRKQAVIELAGVLETLRPTMDGVIAEKDERDLFNIANNFSLRHQNAHQKRNYDPLWLGWIFYHYLATIHLILRRLEAHR